MNIAASVVDLGLILFKVVCPGGVQLHGSWFGVSTCLCWHAAAVKESVPGLEPRIV